MINKILLVTSIVFLVATIIFVLLWRIDNTKYKNTCRQLTEAESKIEVLEKENKNLLEYNIKREEELKQIEAEYKERLDNIPADTCGDVKPSKELLMYLRKQK